MVRNAKEILLESIVKSESSLTESSPTSVTSLLESIVKSESSLTMLNREALALKLESIVKSESSLTTKHEKKDEICLRVLLNQNHL